MSSASRARPATSGAAMLVLAACLVTSTLIASTVLAPTADAADEPGPEQIVNGSFDDGLTGWSAYPESSVVAGEGCVDVPAGTAPYGAGISQTVPVVADQNYRLSVDIHTEPATVGNVRVIVQAGEHENFTAFLPGTKPPLTPASQSLRYDFTPTIDYPSAEVAFQQDVTNAEAYRLCVDNVSVVGGVEREPYVPDTGPRVRVNQVGYLPGGPKEATLVTERTGPVRWKLHDERGRTVRDGESQPEGVDPSAGLNVHTIDFGRYRRGGAGYTLVADGQTSYPFDISRDLYPSLRTDALTLFYTNRSGIEISDALAPGYGRAAGHVGAAPNQGDTAVPCQDLDDDSQQLLVAQGDQPWTCAGTRDVRGGWYDAGDHGKYVVNGGISVAQLMQSYERSEKRHRGTPLGDGTLAIPERDNGVPDLLDEARWELEWLLRMQVPAGEQYAGMANHKVADVDWTGLPLAPAADPRRRVLYRPSTAATLNLAAAAAQGARVFRDHDAAFADRLAAAAVDAYAAAQANPALYAPAPDAELDPNAGSGPYDDDSMGDEFYWAAAELYLTTASADYRDDVVASPFHTSGVFDEGFGWDTVAALGRLDLATVRNRLPDRLRVIESVVAGAERYLAQGLEQPFGQPYAPDDGVYVWGSNSQILNNLQVIGTAYDLTRDKEFADGVLRGADYLLGRNALNISYVTGYGEVFAQNQHSRMYAHQLDPSSPNPPAGSIAGGPNSMAATTGDPVAAPLFVDCTAQFCYIDDINSYATNEITVNWNAPMAWVAAFLADQK